MNNKIIIIILCSNNVNLKKIVIDELIIWILARVVVLSGWEKGRHFKVTSSSDGNINNAKKRKPKEKAQTETNQNSCKERAPPVKSRLDCLWSVISGPMGKSIQLVICISFAYQVGGKKVSMAIQMGWNIVVH